MQNNHINQLNQQQQQYNDDDEDDDMMMIDEEEENDDQRTPHTNSLQQQQNNDAFLQKQRLQMKINEDQREHNLRLEKEARMLGEKDATSSSSAAAQEDTDVLMKDVTPANPTTTTTEHQHNQTNNNTQNHSSTQEQIKRNPLSNHVVQTPPPPTQDNNDSLHMDSEIDAKLREQEKSQHARTDSHLIYPVPIDHSSQLSHIYDNRMRQLGAQTNSTPTDNSEQSRVINTWLPFIDLLLPQRNEVFSFIQQNLLVHLESILSGTTEVCTLEQQVLNGLPLSASTTISSAGGVSSGAPIDTNTGGVTNSSAAGTPTGSSSTAGITPMDTSSGVATASNSSLPRVSSQQLRSLFDYLLPFFHNPHMKSIWRIVLLEMKRRDMTLESRILSRMNLVECSWNETLNQDSDLSLAVLQLHDDDDGSHHKSNASRTSSKHAHSRRIKKSHQLRVHSTSAHGPSDILRMKDIGIKTYLWRLHPTLFIKALHQNDNLYNIHWLCLHVDHIVLYNYMLSEWRKAFVHKPDRRQEIAILRRQFSQVPLSGPNSRAVPTSVSVLRDTIQKKDPLSPLIKILETWIKQHDILKNEFKSDGFTRLKNILRELSRFFDSIQHREKIWRDVSILFSENHLQRIVVHDLFSYICYLYRLNMDKNGISTPSNMNPGSSAASSSTKKKKLDARHTSDMLLVSLQEQQPLLELLQNPPAFSTRVATAIKDHHDQALLVLTQCFLLGEHALLILKKKFPRSLPVVLQTVLSEAYPYIVQLLHATCDAQDSSAAEVNSHALRSSHKVNVLLTDPLLRKLMLRLCIYMLSKKQSHKFRMLMRFILEEDVTLQEQCMDQEFHIFVRPMLEKCVSLLEQRARESSLTARASYHNTKSTFHPESAAHLDETIQLYYMHPILYPLLRKIICPMSEKAPSESSANSVGIEHTSRSDELWLVSKTLKLLGVLNTLRKEDQQRGATPEVLKASHLRIFGDLCTHLNSLLSGGLERVFDVSGWLHNSSSNEEDNRALLDDMKENVRSVS